MAGTLPSGQDRAEKAPSKTGPRVFRGAIVLLFALLLVRLWRLQIVEGREYQYLADQNRFRLLSVDAPRGVIYDREGKLLVRNVGSFDIVILPAKLPLQKEEEVLARLAQLLNMPLESQGETSPGLAEMVGRGRQQEHIPLTIEKDVPRDLALVIEEEHLNLPGVIVKIQPRRQYLYGPLLSQVIGYVGSIPKEEVEYYLGQRGEDYDQNDTVGLTGVELTFEKDLRGLKGRKLVEVDASERELRVLGEEPPEPGHNLILTIDLDLQRVVEEALRKGMEKAGSESAVAIAMNPQNGHILAMVSLPTYDNNLFARGISSSEYQELSSAPCHPLMNHAITGQYPPGSTIKPFLAAAGLEERVISPQTTLSCPGTLLVPHKYFPDNPKLAQPFYCWKRAGHGSRDIIGAIAQSCDVFFYQLGGGYEDFTGLGLERLAKWFRLFGLGEKTGVALSGESSGLVPSDEWKRQNYGESWFLGDTYNASIGQGFVLVTPLQLLNATAAIANGGTLYRPQIVSQITNSKGEVVREFIPEVLRHIPVSQQNLELVRKGLRAAVAEGTARRANVEPIQVAGKTGTAEYPGPRDAQGNLPTHAWFTAFAPVEDAQIALVIFIEGGGEGSAVSAPVTAEILESYFNLPAQQKDTGG